jgi:hypothetical protein
MSEVQKSISTMPRAPSSKYKMFLSLQCPQYPYKTRQRRTHRVDSPEWITISYAVTLSSSNGYASKTQFEKALLYRFETHEKSWLKLAKSILAFDFSAMVAE